MRVFRWLFITLALAFFLSLLAFAALMYTSLESTALVNQADAQQAFSRSNGASKANESSPVGLITINDSQLGKVIHQLLNERHIPSNVRIEFAPDKVFAYATLRMPIEIEKKYINLQIEGRATSPPDHLQIEMLKVGALRVSSHVIQALRDYSLARCNKDRRCRTGLDNYKNINSIELDSGVLKVRYTLGADTFRLLGKTDIDDLHIESYQQALEDLRRQHGNMSIELHEALQAVMRVASERSKEYDPVKENAAALITLAMLNANKHVQEILVQPNKANSPANELQLKVHRRRDLVQHFVNSAALFLIGGTEFSDYIGIYKEVYDVSSGKEFGTGDLIADRAGVRFAQRATRSRRLALEMQQRMLESSDSSGYLLSKTAIKQFENQHSVNATEQIGAIVTVIDKALRKLPLLH